MSVGMDDSARVRVALGANARVSPPALAATVGGARC
jgi:hypothetical protein